MVLDKFLHDDALKIEQLLDENSVDLTILKPPYHRPTNDPSYQIQFMKKIMKKITRITKIGGICCLIVSDDMTENGMDMTETKALLEIRDDPEINSKWVFFEKILWVKSSEDASQSAFSIEGVKAVSFDVTPFSSIWILVRSDNDEDYHEMNIFEHIQKLSISEAKKQEMLESTWFVPQTSEKGYKDQLPKELILRLLMIFSNESDLILDPFSGNGITAVASKILKRHFICIEREIQNITLAQKRFKEIDEHNMFEEM